MKSRFEGEEHRFISGVKFEVSLRHPNKCQVSRWIYSEGRDASVHG
jgi:hypothetical protein